MNEEIVSGLRGAVDRGFKLEESAQSFINAGYNPSDVKEAVSLISRGFSPLPSQVKESVVAKEEPKLNPSSKLKWILIIIAILLVLGVAISFLLFKNQFLGLVIDPFFP